MNWPIVQELLAKELFGNPLQNYAVACGVFFIVIVGLPILKSIVVKQLQALAKRTASDFDDLLVGLLNRVLRGDVYFFTALYLGTLSIELPGNLERIFRALFVIIVVYKAALILQGIAVYGLKKWTERTEKEDPTSAAMIKNATLIVRLGLWVAVVLFILDNLGINITAFVAGLGITGVAVALAAQAVLGDLFSSFAIFTDRPFAVGDFIIVGDLLGTVEHVGFKTTRLRSLFGEQLVFSNSDLTNSRIKNYKRMRERRLEFKFGVVYQTTAEQAMAIPQIVEQIIKEHKMARFDRAHFQCFGDFSLVFVVVYYVLSPDYNLYMDVQQYFNLRIMEEFRRNKIEFAYPTQQLYVTNAGDRPRLPLTE